jgi:hypothetical protein
MEQSGGGKRSIFDATAQNDDCVRVYRRLVDHPSPGQAGEEWRAENKGDQQQRAEGDQQPGSAAQPPATFAGIVDGGWGYGGHKSGTEFTRRQRDVASNLTAERIEQNCEGKWVCRRGEVAADFLGLTRFDGLMHQR